MSFENEFVEYKDFPENVFIDALLESVERMSGIILCEDHNKENTAIENEIIGAMVLQGNHSMLLTIETNRKSASKIVSYMTGIQSINLSDTLLNDGVTELVNMVAGLTRANFENSNYKFELTVPFTIVGDTVNLMVKKRTDSYISRMKGDALSLTMSIYKLK